MTGRTSRTKGQTGERDVAALLRDLLGFDVRRRVRQHDGDSDLEGVPGWSVECKRYRAATRGDLAAWWAQALAQAKRAGVLPVLFYRLDRAEWRAVWPLAIVLAEQRADYWAGYEWTADTSVQAWAAVARDLTVPEERRRTFALTFSEVPPERRPVFGLTYTEVPGPNGSPAGPDRAKEVQ